MQAHSNMYAGLDVYNRLHHEWDRVICMNASSMDINSEACLQRLGDHAHLERERAAKQFEALVKSTPAAQRAALVAGVKELLNSVVWEQRLGGLMGAKVLLEQTDGTSGSSDSDFAHCMTATCLRLLEDPEVRVRLAVGHAMAALAQQEGLPAYQQCRQPLLDSIYHNFDRDALEEEEQQASTGGSSAGGGEQQQQQRAVNGSGDFLSSLLSSTYTVQRPGTGELRHGTEGWKCLETSLRALQQLLGGLPAAAVAAAADEEVLQLTFRCVHHANRFVRETSHLLLAGLCGALPEEQLLGLGPQLTSSLSDGMSDSWSQVRYVACVATRSLLQHVSQEGQQQVLGGVIGPMCLNRYYVADGVRMYSQETWQLVMGDQGRQQVAAHISQVVAYYIAQTKAANLSTREAACEVIAELFDKVDPSAVAPCVPALLRALITAFKDEAWPVRDAACLACARCALAFPEECRSLLAELYPLWCDALWDVIPSVRENTSAALGKVLAAYQEEALERLLPLLRTMLPTAHQQPSETEKYSEGGASAALDTFGPEAARARDNDPALHTAQDMFSCGSLSPYLAPGRMVRGDGCGDYSYSRNKQPWEASDGAVYLLRELSLQYPQLLPEFLPQLSALGYLSTFQRAFNLHHTIWRCLPIMAIKMGSKAFKPHLELFLAPLFRDLRCGNQLAEVAAGNCIGILRDLVGASIFESRLTPDQLMQLQTDAKIPLAGSMQAYIQRVAAVGHQQQQQQQRAGAPHPGLQQHAKLARPAAAMAVAAARGVAQQQAAAHQQRPL